MTLTHADALFARLGDEPLRRVLWAFYAKATRDELLGPVFTRRIGPFPHGGWPLHIARLEGFWRAVTGGPSAYRGQPGPAHAKLGLGPAHFDRWLALWEETLREHLDSSEAEALLTLARRMRVSLERHARLGEQETP
ncbi:group III truncated hemoglobin [Deinococcus sp. YIM 77859]|uniref:group III truncated hemoglobin n=1 Tax=Deinococcus sp. YIM 77859 TaxID=1540221 RepID=UPI0005511F03|nr:group III truncated hemoglobin [Deinococcus sp. YIM 77859]